MARPGFADIDRASFRLVIGALAAIAFFFLIFPTVIVLLTSFTSTPSLRFPPPGYSLRWYASLLDARQMQQAALNSFKVAVAATILSVLLGTSGALAIARSTAGWAKILDSVFMSPLLLPALAFGLAALLYFSLIGVPLSLATLVLGHVAVCVPFVLRTTIASLAQLDPALLDASLSLGAGRFFTFRRVTLPLIGRGIAAGAFLAFMASFDNVPVSLFLTDARTEVLPIHLWQIIDTDLDVRTAAASGVLIVATMVLMVAAERFAGLSKQLH
ncbi:MAG TPA: ABC transporter permease [Xanthobacteraceae bacterium]|nr:ABC transporter permease [Xanthobacteraceae bacterium]